MTDRTMPSVACLKQLTDCGATALLPNAVTGLEKESLRVTPSSNLSQLPHPIALGSALTHSSITTDYSEALLEFITPPKTCIEQSVAAMTDIHRYVHQNLPEGEVLWATSMPCIVDEKNIPIAEYGSSNVGFMKHVYRRGLDLRYGRAMQAIAGIHFNWSMPTEFWPLFQKVQGNQDSLSDFTNDSYFGLIRNFQRLCWLIPYLFGASPAICKSFTNGEQGIFEEFDGHTYFLPFATSLRMSDIGYKNSTQAQLNISYNSINEYVDSLTNAIDTPAEEYKKVGTHIDGQWAQLNTHYLQIENEFYSSVRPKNVARSGEKPTLALKERGVTYVEIRALDLNPYEAAGMNVEQLRFIEALLMYCLWADSPSSDAVERADNDHNQVQVALYGRDPKLKLKRNGQPASLRDWALEITEQMQPICEVLDQSRGDQTAYQDSLKQQIAAINNPDLTTSARVLSDMRERGENFVEFGRRQSKELAEQLKKTAPSHEVTERLQAEAAESLLKQKDIEDKDTVSFETFLADYFAQK